MSGWVVVLVTGLTALTREPLAGQAITTSLSGWCVLKFCFLLTGLITFTREPLAAAVCGGGVHSCLFKKTCHEYYKLIGRC